MKYDICMAKNIQVGLLIDVLLELANTTSLITYINIKCSTLVQSVLIDFLVGPTSEWHLQDAF